MADATADAVLARAAAEGDRRAFAEIYDRYADRLYDFSVGLLGDRDAAADCVQDAFCVAATDLGNLREPEKLRPWLYSITRHHVMRRLRHRYREEVSDALPDTASDDAGPDTVAGQSELARLVAEAAGGLSDRDRDLLELSYRHGLDGPELAEVLKVTLTSANTMVFRLRQTIERCLGALLLARNARTDSNACPELVAILKGWDGQFTVLMRKRIARHIESCETCGEEQRRRVNPVALLGGAPVFIPAPDWLRRQTLDRIQLTCASSNLTETSGSSVGSSITDSPVNPTGSRQIGKQIALAVGVPLLCLGLTITWFRHHDDPVSRMVDIGTDSSEGPLPVVPAAIKGTPTLASRKPVPPGGTVQSSVPTSPAKTASMANPPSAEPGPSTPGAAPAPALVLPNPGPDIATPLPKVSAAPIPNSDPTAITPDDQADSAPAPISGGTTSTTGGATTGTTGTTGGSTTGGSTTGGSTTGGSTTGGSTTGGRRQHHERRKHEHHRRQHETGHHRQHETRHHRQHHRQHQTGHHR
ncbi:MAG: sigma-70 family RNA polymerase sigma factor [Mycobacterium sp.]|nr:sigma-70 family RNA polymerase sigma factor [Mycobacterium sp.]